MTLEELPGTAKPDLAPAPAVPAAPAVSVASKDRRRPDRPDHASPHLIPLLRTAETGAAAAPGTSDELPFEDALAPAKGIAIGLVLSVPLWAAIGGIVWALL